MRCSRARIRSANVPCRLLKSLPAVHSPPMRTQPLEEVDSVPTPLLEVQNSRYHDAGHSADDCAHDGRRNVSCPPCSVRHHPAAEGPGHVEPIVVLNTRRALEVVPLGVRDQLGAAACATAGLCHILPASSPATSAGAPPRRRTLDAGRWKRIHVQRKTAKEYSPATATKTLSRGVLPS